MIPVSLELLTDRHWFEFELDFSRFDGIAANVSLNDSQPEKTAGTVPAPSPLLERDPARTPFV